MRVVIVRHGNTFDKGESVRRVGLRSDLPLSSSGIVQVEKLAIDLKAKYDHFDSAFASELQRTQQTATAILNHYPNAPQLQISAQLNEVDYGDDDGKPESEVVSRLGEDAIKAWDAANKVPQGWLIDPKKIIEGWQTLANQWIEQKYQSVLVVTSNGIAKFAMDLLGSNRPADLKAKLKTAHYGEIQLIENQWRHISWGSSYYSNQ